MPVKFVCPECHCALRVQGSVPARVKCPKCSLAFKPETSAVEEVDGLAKKVGVVGQNGDALKFDLDAPIKSVQKPLSREAVLEDAESFDLPQKKAGVVTRDSGPLEFEQDEPIRAVATPRNRDEADGENKAEKPAHSKYKKSKKNSFPLWLPISIGRGFGCHCPNHCHCPVKRAGRQEKGRRRQKRLPRHTSNRKPRPFRKRRTRKILFRPQRKTKIAIRLPEFHQKMTSRNESFQLNRRTTSPSRSFRIRRKMISRNRFFRIRRRTISPSRSCAILDPGIRSLCLVPIGREALPATADSPFAFLPFSLFFA